MVLKVKGPLASEACREIGMQAANFAAGHYKGVPNMIWQFLSFLIPQKLLELVWVSVCKKAVRNTQRRRGSPHV